MSVKIRRLVNPYEERMLEFLLSCIGNHYRIHTQVSLAQICEVNTILSEDLKKFLFSSTALDALITDLNFMPQLVVEFQSSYHEKLQVQERDRKKSEILSLAGIPLMYSRIKDFGLLHLSSHNREVVFNLFTGAGREQAIEFVRDFLSPSEN